jgi:hypothetical protein
LKFCQATPRGDRESCRGSGASDTKLHGGFIQRGKEHRSEAALYDSRERRGSM